MASSSDGGGESFVPHVRRYADDLEGCGRVIGGSHTPARDGLSRPISACHGLAHDRHGRSVDSIAALERAPRDDRDPDHVQVALVYDGQQRLVYDLQLRPGCSTYTLVPDRCPRAVGC
jgi:hypothetical protein